MRKAHELHEVEVLFKTGWKPMVGASTLAKAMSRAQSFARLPETRGVRVVSHLGGGDRITTLKLVEEAPPAIPTPGAIAAAQAGLAQSSRSAAAVVMLAAAAAGASSLVAALFYKMATSIATLRVAGDVLPMIVG